MASEIIWANFAKTTLAAGIGAADVTANLAVGTGGKFPAPGANQYFKATLVKAGAAEVVKCTARAGDQVTIVRAQEGTVALTFNAGEVFELRVSKETLEAFEQKDKDEIITAKRTFSEPITNKKGQNFAIATGAVNAYEVVLDPDPGLLTTANAGVEVAFQANLANTSTTPTLKVGANAGFTITKNGRQALLAGDIPANGEVRARLYNDAGTLKWELLTPSALTTSKSDTKDHGTKTAAYTLNMEEAHLHTIEAGAAFTLTIASARTLDRATVIIKSNGWTVTLAGIDTDSPTLTALANTQDFIGLIKSKGKITAVGVDLGKAAV